MTPLRARSARITLIELVVLCTGSGVLIVLITAAAATDTVAITLPPVEKIVYAAIAFLFEEMIRRGFKKVDRTHERVQAMDVALRGYDGKGGALDDIRALQEQVRTLSTPSVQSNEPRRPLGPLSVGIPDRRASQ